MKINIDWEKVLMTAILIIILMLLLTSCGSRKVDKSKTEITETQTSTKLVIDSSKVTTITDSNTKIIDNSITDEFTIIPVDNSKPITVNGKTYFNVQIKHSNKKNNISVVQDIKASQIKQNNVKIATTDNKVKKVFIEEKKIERKQSYWWLLWFLLLIPIYLLWRKYRGLIF